MTNYVTDIEFTKIIKIIFKKKLTVLFLVHIFVIIYYVRTIAQHTNHRERTRQL